MNPIMRVRGSAMIRREGKLLVLAYDYPKGRIFAIPGGGVKKGETLSQSIVREYQEELSIQIQVGDLRFVGDMQAQETIPQTVHLVFDGEILSGTPCLNRTHTSAAEYLWLDLDDLDQIKLYPHINQALREDLKNGIPRPRYLGNCLNREWS